MAYPYGRHHDPNHGRYGGEEERENDNYDQPPPPPRPHFPNLGYGVDEPPRPHFPTPGYGVDGPPRPHFPNPGYVIESGQPRPHFPNSGYGVDEPPPSNVYHTSHFGGMESFSHGPPPPQVYHTSHVGGPVYDYDPPLRLGDDPPPPSDHGHHRPHMPHFPSSDHHSSSRKEDDIFPDKPSVKVYSKAETNYALTIRDGKVILARANSSDLSQHWIKDQKYSTKVKDEEGFPSFSLINKATGQALKHAIGATQPVQLTHHDGNTYDESILWTESRDLGDGYRTIRSVNNIKLNIDAFNGDQNHGGVHDGTTIVLWEWKKGDNQRWKIVPY